ISVCSLWMHISRLWMAISKLCTAIQSLQTEISALGRGNKSQSQRMKNTYLCKLSRQFFVVSTTNFPDGSFATGYDPSA
ncbi:MAG: hypothetical protein SPF66_04125, partial [Bacteroidaceae bacterium]|nr:hypothetical protein [Bacteroidaceae bacterium]